ncbi:hypothetical protein ACM66B_006725 [Microbotryomycetes sp. NB124-2]
MRESNVSFPSQNRACVCISSALYDRRAIDAPAPSLPLVNSLTHLSYLTATSPRIREILAVDGGLERLVRILKACVTGGPVTVDEPLSKLKGKSPASGKAARRSPFKAFAEYAPTIDLSQFGEHSMDVDSAALSTTATPSSSSRAQQLLFTYTLAFQCVVNIGVRGSETIRTRVVEAGALDVVVTVLEHYLKDMHKRKVEAEAKAKDSIRQATAQVPALTRPRARVLESSRFTTLSASLSDSASAAATVVPPARMSTPDTVVSMDEGDTGSSSGHDDELVAYNSQRTTRCRACETKQAHHHGEELIEFSTDQQQNESEQVNAAAVDAGIARQQLSPSGLDEPFQFRDEDVLLSLQLLAYLSKYPHVRTVFHSPSLSTMAGNQDAAGKAVNVFSLVEQFTHRPSTLDTHTPRHSNEVQYWAGVIMRNACRKDESRGGIRQCANTECGLWERYAREFAKCRRCRKAKYCSKTCQSTAWSKGHRYWCAKAAPKESSTGVAAGAAGSSEALRHDDSTLRDRMQIDDSSVTGASTSSRRDLRRRDSRSGTASGRTSRSSGAAEEEEDDDDELHVPAAPSASSAFARVSPAGGRRQSLGPAPPTVVGDRRRIGGLDTLADMNGVAVGMALGMDEAQVAQDMMNGNEVVFGGGEGNDVVM